MINPSGFVAVSERMFNAVLASMDYERTSYYEGSQYQQRYGDTQVFAYELQPSGRYFLHPDLVE